MATATKSKSKAKSKPVTRNKPKSFKWQKMAGKNDEIKYVIAKLGKEKFAPRAKRYDEEASFPFENYEDLRDTGILAMTVPKSLGGLGVKYADYALLAAEMGRWCGATALTFNMHACTPLWTGHIADDLDMPAADRKQHKKNRELHFSRIVEEGAIFAQPFSEGSSAAAGKAPFGTLAAKVDGGWLLNGKKIFASLSGAATYYGVLCTEDKPDSSVRDTVFMAVPADAEGVSIVGPWDPVGMRATVSRTLVMENVFIPDEQMLMQRGVYYQAARRWPHMFDPIHDICPYTICLVLFNVDQVVSGLYPRTQRNERLIDLRGLYPFSTPCPFDVRLHNGLTFDHHDLFGVQLTERIDMVCRGKLTVPRVETLAGVLLLHTLE